MKSYIRIYGPPVLKALRALAKIAAESPEVIIASYYEALPFDVPDKERRSKLISKSGQTLGDNDFFFEWAKDPTRKELEELISKIDEALGPLGCKYTIATR